MLPLRKNLSVHQQSFLQDLRQIPADYQIESRSAEFKILDYEIASEQYGVGFAKGNDAVKDQVQKTLEEMAADGTLAKISTKWFGEDITTIGK